MVSWEALSAFISSIFLMLRNVMDNCNKNKSTCVQDEIYVSKPS